VAIAPFLKGASRAELRCLFRTDGQPKPRLTSDLASHEPHDMMQGIL